MVEAVDDFDLANEVWLANGAPLENTGRYLLRFGSYDRTEVTTRLMRLAKNDRRGARTHAKGSYFTRAERAMTPDETTKREKIAMRLRTNYFTDEARKRSDFSDFLNLQVDRVIAIVDALDGECITYDDLNDMQADVVILEGLTALGLVDRSTCKRWYKRVARFLEAMADSFPPDAPPDATVGDRIPEQQVQELWRKTA
jgi:hypothetical protein